MDWYFLTFLLSVGIVFLVPIVSLYLLGKKHLIKALVISSFYFPIAVILTYPVGLFTFTMYKVEPLFPTKCDQAIQILNQYDNRVSSNYDTYILTLLFDVLPQSYVFSTRGICEYKLQNYALSKHALVELLSLDHDLLSKRVDIKKYQDLLNKIND